MTYPFLKKMDIFHIIKTLVCPNEICESVEDIDTDMLLQKGIETVYLDIDNTLVSLHQRQLSLEKIEWVESLKTQGFSVFLLSNNRSKARVQRICKQLNIKGVYWAAKPFPFSLREVAEEQGVNLRKSAVVGDQVFTDVLVGNWVGSHSILVEPLDKRLSFIKTWQRELELAIMSKFS